MVIGGDINFTLGALKIEGLDAHMDSLFGYSIRKLEDLGLL